MKICLFGGTFDPPHLGHLIVAQTICEAEQFEKIIFIPACISPHKRDNDLTAVELRLEMLQLAVEGNPNFEISDIEIRRGGVSYTVDTITAIKAAKGLSREELYFLIGSDTLATFQTWKKPREILELCRVIVALRPGFRPGDIPSWILRRIQFANIPRIEISSHIVRLRWRSNKTIRYMVSQPVWEYINAHNLYLP